MYKGKDIIAMACSCSFENTPLLLFIGINLKKIGFLKIQFLGLKVYSSYFKVPKMIVIKTMLYRTLILQKKEKKLKLCDHSKFKQNREFWPLNLEIPLFFVICNQILKKNI